VGGNLLVGKNVSEVFIEEELAHHQPRQCGEGLDSRTTRGKREKEGLSLLFSLLLLSVG
jgi:hypothetical protein